MRNLASTSSTNQDGFSVGQLRTLTIDQDGLISGIFTNGVTLQLARFALATFNNMNMQRTTIHYVNMKGSKISDCHLVDVEVTGGEIDGMKIHGVLVTDMMAAYNEKHGQEPAAG